MRETAWVRLFSYQGNIVCICACLHRAGHYCTEKRIREASVE